jgi:hypothetical protein
VKRDIDGIHASREGPMSRKEFRAIASTSFVMTFVLGAALQAQENRPLYAVMAPIEQYLMTDRNAEIALARSAAPAAISGEAKVMVLGRHGYETAVEGKNGFVCIVERSWMSPFDSPEFWNSKMRGPICYNPPAVRSILPFTFKRTELALGRLSKLQMLASIKAAFARKELPTPEPGAMSYMLSKDGYLGDSAGHWYPHLMFHIPKTEGSTWGANLPGSPVILDTQHSEVPEPETIFMVPVGTWSDGTPAPPM